MPEPDSAIRRCAWCGTGPLYIAYHGLEWGVPSYDERHLFEMLILEGVQAGLSWLTILRKREGSRQIRPALLGRRFRTGKTRRIRGRGSRKASAESHGALIRPDLPL